MKFDYFVLPFTLGLVFLFVYLGITYARWFMQLDKPDRKAIGKGFFSLKLFSAAQGNHTRKPAAPKNIQEKPVAGFYAHEPGFWLVFTHLHRES